MAVTNKKGKKSVPAEATVSEKTEAVKEPVKSDTKYRVKKNLDPNIIVTVRNGFQGQLVYISPKTKERFIWESFGDEQDMELQELKTARNSSKAFFENNWFLIDDPEILDYLGVTQYYKYALNFDTFNELFDETPEKIKEAVSHLSVGQKKSVAYRAKQMITEQKIDSIKTIKALEESLSIDLIEE